jgi:hypothetical protein
MEKCDAIMIRLKENFAQYAMHKYSSNVIEKCVERADSKIIDEFKSIVLINGDDKGQSLAVKMLLRSQHSFFIVQKIYNRLDSEADRQRVLELLHENIANCGDKLIKSKCMAIINKGPALPPQQPNAPAASH